MQPDEMAEIEKELKEIDAEMDQLSRRRFKLSDRFQELLRQKVEAAEKEPATP